ncbi:hypothetical protein RB597_009835 [Gaeumannomyces tritici]
MAGTASPSAPGPSVAPPPLPSGWIAQWDESTRKYYYVELGTGRSQWDVPTQPAPTAISTPANSSVNHPYGIPPSGASPAQQPRIITHPDGSQTIQHADGRLEPILPPGTAGALEGTRGMDGPSGDRGLGSFAQNALNSFAGKQGGGGGGAGAGNFGGKLVSGLASSLFSSGGDKPQPQSYHGAPQTGPHSSGGLAGAVMGGVATMFGGSQGKPSGNFGYSNAGPASYSGTAPPISYQPPSQPGTSPTARSAPAPHSQPSPSYHQPQQSPSFQQPQHSPAYQQPPHQQPPAPYGGYAQRSTYGGQPQYEHHQPQPQPPYGGQHQYAHQPAYPGHPPPPSQPGYQSRPPY